MQQFYSRALRETFSSPRLLPIAILGTFLSLVSVASAAGLWQQLTLLAMLLVVGYQISYIRKVAVDPAPGLPAFHFWRCLRRGFGGLFVMLPAALLVLVLLGILLGPSGLSRSTSYAVVNASLALTALAVYPGLARYAYSGKVSEGLRYVRAFRQVLALGVTALTPVVAWMFLWIVQNALDLIMAAAFGQQAEWLISARSVLAGSGSLSDFGVLLLSLIVAAVTFVGALLQGHVVGQVAARAFAPTDDAGVALTSASS